MRHSWPSIASLVSAVTAQQVAYGQCGGSGFTGSTTCVAGYACTTVNDYYSQCQPSTDTTPSTSDPSLGSGSAAGKLKWLGVSESSAEWGTALPGVSGKDYTFPSTATIDTLIADGYNIFRVPFAMERLAVSSITASFDATYLSGLSNVINHITSKGKYAVIDPHNYGRYKGAIIQDVSAFGTFWKNLATQFKSDSNVIFDINNEFNTMSQDLVLQLNQAGINAIRAAGATSQYIFAEGNSWSGASTWASVNDNLKGLTDPNNKLIYEMHEYLDSDGSGTKPECTSTTVGVDRVTGATAWLKANKKLGVIGEFAGGANAQCKTAVTGLLDHLSSNSDVWLGALWWAAGPWWGNVTEYTFEPPSGTAYVNYGPILKKYLP